MTIQEQKIILRLLTPEQIAEMFPAAVEDVPRQPSTNLKRMGACAVTSPDDRWWCTRINNHDGPHIRHKIGRKAISIQLPIAWLNKKEKM